MARMKLTRRQFPFTPGFLPSPLLASFGEFDDLNSYAAPTKITLALEQGNPTADMFVGTIHSASLKKTSDFEV